ncbi:hypothetical protein [Streptomyces luteogriseus]
MSRLQEGVGQSQRLGPRGAGVPPVGTGEFGARGALQAGAGAVNHLPDG